MPSAPVANAAQQFVSALLAEANLEFARNSC